MNLPTIFKQTTIFSVILISGMISLLIQCNGTRPSILGVKENKLTSCPKTPNCINSFSDPKDEVHYKAAIPFKKPIAEAKNILKQKIQDYPRTEIIKEESNYIYAEFTSLLMRYVDDVEFYFDEKSKTLHFRSASRLGSGDFGVNRKRIETLTKDLDI
jgi:uncharacterized protein (DUF1499 family)